MEEINAQLEEFAGMRNKTSHSQNSTSSVQTKNETALDEKKEVKSMYESAVDVSDDFIQLRDRPHHFDLVGLA
jgi:hypothetical protein